ncbi:MAG: zinc-binding alcohol dehydrogenase family protein [Streptosporangiales bacterium]|nr:zinc-binding alcohol dehydrogenase family protein [Streptosporangiales bacterium]
MKAAVVTSPGGAPRYDDVPVPEAAGPRERVVRVLAAGLHPEVRSQAGETPFVPGADGIGTGGDGRPRYFLREPGRPGTLAEQTVIDTWHSVPLPAACDPVRLAAGIYPALPPWLGLRCRAGLRAGQEVLVLGPDGAAGPAAVQAARALGAGTIVAAGRDAGQCSALAGAGAAETVPLDSLDLVVEAASGADIVLDYVWGQFAAAAMTLMVAARGDRGRPLNWVLADAPGGPSAPLPAAVLRGSGLRITGAGPGSATAEELTAEVPEIARYVSSGVLGVDTVKVPLSDVERTWKEPADGTRSVVFVP